MTAENALRGKLNGGNWMELLNPSMRIQNAEGPHWIVSFEHEFNDDERIVSTVKVVKSSRSLLEIEREAFDRATELLQVVSSKPD